MYLELNSLELRAVSCYLWEFPVGSLSVTDQWIGLERGIPTGNSGTWLCI